MSMDIKISSEDKSIPIKRFQFALPDHLLYSRSLLWIRDTVTIAKHTVNRQRKTWTVYFGVLSLNLVVALRYSMRENHGYSPFFLALLGFFIGLVQLSTYLDLDNSRPSYCYYLILLIVSSPLPAQDSMLYKFSFSLLLLLISPKFVKKEKSLIISIIVYLVSEYLQYYKIYEVVMKLIIFSLLMCFVDQRYYIETQQSKIHKIKESLKENNACDSNSPINSIISSINHSMELLKEFSDTPEVSEAMISMLHILKVLEKNPNIYSPSLKRITKNMDIEDKIFIEQNTYTIPHFDISDLTPSKPIIQELVYGVSELSGILNKIGKDWNFNPFLVHSCTAGAALYTCAEYTFRYYNFHEAFSIPPKTSINFFRAMESKYLPNPYHNSMHGADVMASFLFLCEPVFTSITCIELLSCLVACLGHDIGHPGTNNRFLVQTKHDLALQYNDSSVLENMHARDLFSLLIDENCNILKNIGDYWIVRKIIIEMILSTDMAKHFDIVGSNKAKQKTIAQRMEVAGERLEVYKLFIKASDIAHTAKETDLHERWCKLVIEEFFTQGDREKELGLQVSMYCDRANTDICKSQVGFIKNIAMPLFEEISRLVQWSKIDEVCLSHIRENIAFWNKGHLVGRNSTIFDFDFAAFRAASRRVTLPKVRYFK